MNPIIDKAPLLLLAGFSLICLMACHTKVFKYLLDRCTHLEDENRQIKEENASLREANGQLRGEAEG